jgi:hypothetical protein
VRQVNLDTGALTLDKTKNGDAWRAYLPAELVAALREQLANLDALQVKTGRVFRRVFVFTHRGAARTKRRLLPGAVDAGLPCRRSARDHPPRSAP